MHPHEFPSLKPREKIKIPEKIVFSVGKWKTNKQSKWKAEAEKKNSAIDK